MNETKSPKNKSDKKIFRKGTKESRLPSNIQINSHGLKAATWFYQIRGVKNFTENWNRDLFP